MDKDQTKRLCFLVPAPFWCLISKICGKYTFCCYLGQIWLNQALKLKKKYIGGTPSNGVILDIIFIAK